MDPTTAPKPEDQHMETNRDIARQVIADRLSGMADPGSYGDLACTADRAAALAVQALDEKGLLTGERQGRTAATPSEVAQGDLTPGDFRPAGVADYRQPLTDFERNAGVIPVVQLDTDALSLDDPADLDAILDQSPGSLGEVHRRGHLAPFMLDLLDPAVDTTGKTNALRHLVACDPWRAIAGLASMASEWLAVDGVDTRDLVQAMRAMIAQTGRP